MSRPVALLLLRQVQCGAELRPVAEALRAAGWACHAVAGREAQRIAGMEAHVAWYEALGCPVIDYEGRPLAAAGAGPQATPGAARRAVAALARSPGLRGPATFFSHRKEALAWRDRASRLLGRLRPSIIILQEFGLLCEEAVIERQARRLGIPTLMVPSADNGQVPTSSLQAFLASPRGVRVDTRRLFNRLVGRVFPRFARRYRGVGMLRYPAATSLAYWSAGLMDGDPWLPHRDVTRRAVLCERARQDILREQGVAPARLMVTGQPAMDAMHAALQLGGAARAARWRSLGLSPERPVAVFIVPPLVQHSLVSEPEQQAFVGQVLAALAAAPGAQVVLHCYAGLETAPYEALARRTGAVMARGMDVRELIPAADVVVNVRSSVTWAAIACQVPTIMVDYWGLGPVNYYECPGVRLVRTPEELRDAAAAWLGGGSARADAVRALRAAAPVWASGFDGRATERVIALAHEMAGVRHQASAAEAVPAGAREEHHVG